MNMNMWTCHERPGPRDETRKAGPAGGGDVTVMGSSMEGWIVWWIIINNPYDIKYLVHHIGWYDIVCEFCYLPPLWWLNDYPI